MKINIATLFPAMCEAVLSESIIGRARKAGKIDIQCFDIRAFSTDKHRRVDDYPYGGGPGMVMQAQPIFDCCAHIESVREERPHTVFMGAGGTKLTQAKCVELSKKSCITFVCGHYEGIDQRVIDEIADEEISIGDYVLTGGELAALVITDAIARMCDGVLASEEGFVNESHYDGLLEHPQYTRPEVWHGVAVPEVLLSGHHKNIEKWKEEQAKQRTEERRPDMAKK